MSDKGTKFFDGFPDFFKKRSTAPIHEDNAPPQVKRLGEALRKIQPMLEDFVRVTREIPVEKTILDIALEVDGKPCNFHFEDNFTPDIIKKMGGREMMGEVVEIPRVQRAPKEDLVHSIETLLRKIYKETDTEILGAIYSPHHSAALAIGQILENARDRDRALIGKEIKKLLEGFRY